MKFYLTLPFMLPGLWLTAWSLKVPTRSLISELYLSGAWMK
jgi:hypothetical protein